MTIAVEAFEGSPVEWDTFVRAAPGWTHFHLYGWRGVLADAMRHEGIYLAARDRASRALRGVLPLVRVRSILFGHFLVSMPFVNYGGPLGDDEAVAALARAAAARAAADRVKLLELRSRRELPLDLAVSHRKITVLLPLPSGDAALLWDGLKAKVRSQVRRPQKEGVVARFGPDQLRPFYEVFARHMRDLGTPVLSRRVFEAVARAFPEDAWFGCAYLGRRAVAGGCGFRWGDEFEMTWASSLREFNRMAPNMLLYWAFMERCIERGVRTFNFGRCTPGGGTHRFKKQWGTCDVPLHWYQASPKGVSATPSPDGGALAWGPRIWRRLPLPVANLVGPLVVRGIP